MNQRSKDLEMDLKISRNSEQDIKNALKRETKMLIGKIFEAKKRLPNILKQHTNPLEEKLIMAFGIMDKYEGQIEEVEEKVTDLEKINDVIKRKELEDESSESEEEDNLFDIPETSISQL
jgi:hypothetical protein